MAKNIILALIAASDKFHGSILRMLQVNLPMALKHEETSLQFFSVLGRLVPKASPTAPQEGLSLSGSIGKEAYLELLKHLFEAITSTLAQFEQIQLERQRLSAAGLVIDMNLG